MSTKYDARQRKEIKDHKVRMARARGEIPIDDVAESIGWFAASAMIGLVTAAICILLGVAP